MGKLLIQRWWDWYCDTGKTCLGRSMHCPNASSLNNVKHFHLLALNIVRYVASQHRDHNVTTDYCNVTSLYVYHEWNSSPLWTTAECSVVCVCDNPSWTFLLAGHHHYQRAQQNVVGERDELYGTDWIMGSSPSCVKGQVI